MKSTIRTVITSVAAGALAFGAPGVGTAAGATPHTTWTPKAGKACGMSGTARIIDNRAYWCVSATEGALPRWSSGVATSRSPLTVSDGWAKAADTGMSAAFGIITNPTGRPLTVVAALSPVSGALQLHEVVDRSGSMVMQQKAGGFVIPANGSVELRPGGNHLMFLKVTRPVTAGAMVPLTLITSDGGLLRTRVLAKVFMGANEDYSGGSGAGSAGTAM